MYQEQLPFSGDICRNFHSGADTSVEAFQATKPRVPAIRDMIVNLIRSRPLDGWTCEEVEQRLQLAHTTCSARIAELQAQGRIVRSGRFRQTASGCKARVYVITDSGNGYG